jgi:ribosome-associated protein
MRKDKTVKIVEKALEDHKAEDIVTIDVSEKTPFADFYVLATAGNIRQLNALKEIVEEELEKNKMSINHIEGTPESGWILIDAHHVIVNIFSKAERERISLEEVMSRK